MVQVTRFAVNASKAGTQDDVQLARLTDGSIIAVWASNDGGATGRNIRAQRFDHLGNPVGSEFVANTDLPEGLNPATYFQGTPDVAALSDGGYIVTYIDNRPTSTQSGLQNVLVGQRFDSNNQKVGTDASLTPVFVATDNPYRAAYQDVVGLPTGGYLMTFTARALGLSDAFADPDTGIRLAGYSGNTPFDQSAGGDLFSVKTVNTLKEGIQTGSKIEALAGPSAGRAVIVWNTDSVTEDGIQFGYQLKAQIVDASGAKIGSEITVPRLARLSQSSDGERYDIAGLADGGFVIVFEQFPTNADFTAGTRTSLYLQIYNADGSQRGALIPVEPPETTDNIQPTIAAHSDGTFMVAWVDDPDMAAGGMIKGQFFQSNGTKIDAPFMISNLQTAKNQKNPEAALTGNGTYFVAWEDNGREYGEPDIGIVGAIVDRAGTAPGGGGGGLTAALVGAATHNETTDTTTYNITIRLSGPATKSFTVFYTIEPGDVLPASSADFVGTSLPASGQVVFGIGEQEKIVPIQIAGDAIVEGNETFKVLIFETEPDVVTSPSIQTVTILEGSAGPKIPVLLSGGTIVEGTFLDGGETGATNYTVTIALQSPATKTETLTWGVKVGSPSVFNASSADFKNGVLPSGTLTFAPGESSKTVTIPILADGFVEETEQFYVTVSNLSSGLSFTGSGEVPILIANDDSSAGKVKLILPPGGGILEGTSTSATQMQVTLKLDKASTSVQNLDWFVKLGPGLSNVDFDDFFGFPAGIAPSGTIYFQPGETSKTVVIPIAADSLVEGSEFFTFSLTGVSEGIEAPTLVDTRLYIVDDDNPANPSIAQTFVQNTDVAKGLAAAYQLLLGGVPNEAGFKFLIDAAVATNFGAGAGPVFNTENIYINLVNNLAQGNPGAQAAFAALAPGATLAAKIEAVYKAIIPIANQTAEGLAFLTRPEGVAFYQAVAAERGVAGSDGAAIVALAALVKIATDQNIGIGGSLNALVNAVFAGADNLPATGTTLTSLNAVLGAVTPPPEEAVKLVGMGDQTEFAGLDLA